ncbi:MULTISPECIES: DUF948 domain-containing protein [Bacillus]|uniref:Uncharacterized protein YoxC n=1 Tax=Bacillus capparidis TaxID=1840411 RepID=A0ABS4CRU3_9BACI|nr:MULTISPECIES: DUF948 domain-containing protein [Bacillus]MBP1080297.1 uncharacterized protein YoxC [Bacillus capparidis]MED1094160.1 DUF948 domain-containing protein [Bacillus capparidis]
MTIVYVSAALIIISLVYLGVSGVKAKKEINTSLNKVQASVGQLQNNIEEIKNEANRLSDAQQKIQLDINLKKEKVNDTVDACKDLGTTFQKLKKTEKPGTIIVAGIREYR